MTIGVMVLDGPYQHQAADSAYQFVKAAIARGHEIAGIFLFTDGVNNAQRFVSPPGERNIPQLYNELGAQGVEIVACTACAKFRGLKPDLKVDNVKLSGLGALENMLGRADRFVTFGS